MATPVQARRPSRALTIILLAFCLPFLAGGVAVGWFALAEILDDTRARAWAETEARIRQVDLEYHSGSESGTYEVTCSYDYTFGGRQYTGHRVGLSGGSDNIGSWQQDTYARLKQAFDEGRPVPCYVNPDRPDEALLDRQIRFPALFLKLMAAMLFSGIGLGMAAGGFYHLRVNARGLRLRSEHPDRPWLDNPRWASGVVVNRMGTRAVVTWAVAAFWNVFSLPVVVLLPAEVVKRHNYTALLAGVVPLIGLGLLVWAFRSTSRLRRFGRSRLELETLPGRVGGHLRGRLVLAGAVEAIDEVEAKLACTRRLTTTQGSKTQTAISKLWEQPQRLRSPGVPFGQTEVSLPFDFQIPGGCRPTDDRDLSDVVEWQVAVRAPVPGVDLKLTFPVPVFAGEAEAPAGDEPAENLPSSPPDGPGLSPLKGSL